MTARVAGFVTRAQAGLVAPRAASRVIDARKGGVAVHYGGPAVPISGHASCLRTWRGWQAYHMLVHGWDDIAYTMGVCQHGYALAGRGAGVRTAAQGTNDGNDRFYAVCWIGGQGQTPTPAATDAIEWCIRELRRVGAAGKQVKPHHFFHTTQCPGDPLTGFARVHDGKDIVVPVPPKPPAPRVPAYPGVTKQGMRNSPITRAYQSRLKQRGWKITVDGDHGPTTTRVLTAFQKEKHLRPVVLGEGGRVTWTALWTKPL